jgi:hypothetical protein
MPVDFNGHLDLFPRVAMTHPLRIAYSDALYHAALRGDRRAPIFEGDTERRFFLDTMAETQGQTFSLV